MKWLNKIFGTKNERTVKTMWPRVHEIAALEPEVEKLSDDQLKDRIQAMKVEVMAEMDTLEKAKEDPTKPEYNEILDKRLNETFSIVREAAKRVLNMRHYDVQIMGGIVLNEGKISEMKTGEGKTLVATLPVILNALSGRSVHVVTVNDYLASRDAEWMGRIYRFLGMTVGVVLPSTGDQDKIESYKADITYGQNNEFGFDYLRDNMKFSLKDYVQRGHFFAIVDEVDSILIDEARTPLIISGPTDDTTDKYQIANEIIPKLRKESEFSVDEKSRTVILTEAGVERCEQLLKLENLFDPVNIEIQHHINQALRAHAMFKRDVDYVIERGEVVIVDEHTGRLMHGRRWSDGLHQSIEAKESVTVQAENQTLATITFQNYFRMHKKLSGMTGTADTEAEEFAKIYDLDCVVIPTNKPLLRLDENDLVYKSEVEKFRAIADDLKTAHEKGQPALVGTVSVEKSEIVSKLLKKLKIPHEVLNAKRHKDEAGIVAQAGKSGHVTIATNMAGRGTDIVLGGDAEFIARNTVAKKLNESADQVAEFGFLTGRPDLINTDNLAERDSNNIRLLHSLQEQILQARWEGAPESLEEAHAHIFKDRKEYYDKAVAAYAVALEDSAKACAADKKIVLAAGGLHIIGTERHESRRIDNQLRGRSGRQGDPGSSCFYLSLEDDLMRIFGSDRMISVMTRLGMEENVPIEHPWVSKSIANAQKRVEGQHFDSRKQLIEYDDVMNMQRNTVYKLRREVLGQESIRELILDLVEQAVVNAVKMYAPEKASPAEWKLPGLEEDIKNLLGIQVQLGKFAGDRNDLMDTLFKTIETYYTKKEKDLGGDSLRQVERFVYLQTIDQRWKDHLAAMDHLREGIHFRGYAQKDPKQEYKKEGFNLFMAMMAQLRDDTLEKIFKAEIKTEERDRLQRELARLREEQQIKADELRKKQVLGRGAAEKLDTDTKSTLKKVVPLDAAIRSLEGEEGPSMNRQQRRLAKARNKKQPRG